MDLVFARRVGAHEGVGRVALIEVCHQSCQIEDTVYMSMSQQHKIMCTKVKLALAGVAQKHHFAAAS